MTRGPYLSTRNLKAISLASLLFVYLVLALSFFSVSYTETIHRVTMTRTFEQSIFGSEMGDSLAAIGFALLFLSLDFPATRLRLASCTVFGISILGLVMGSEYLLFGGLVTIPLLAGLLVARTLSRKRRNSSINSRSRLDVKRVATAFLIILIILEVGALSRWIVHPALPSEIYGDPTWKFTQLESALFHSFGSLSPVMVILLTFSFLYKNYIVGLIRKPIGDHEKDGEKSSRQDTHLECAEKKNIEYYPADYRLGSNNNIEGSSIGGVSPIVIHRPSKVSHKPSTSEWAILLGAITASIVITLYPHLPGVNESGAGISTDERSYMKWLADLRVVQSEASWGVVSAAFNINDGDRPLSLLLMLFLGDLSGLPDATIVRFLPAFLAPCLVLVSYFLVRHGYLIAKSQTSSKKRKRIIAAVIAIAAAISPQIIVGLYAGFLANWLALIPAILAMLFAVRIFDEAERDQGGNKWKHIVVFSVCLFAALTLAMLFHVYTWGYLVLVVLLFTFISYLFLRKSRTVRKKELLKVIAILVSVIIASILADYAKSSYFGISSGFSRDSFLAGRSFDLGNFNSRLETLDFTLKVYVGGFISNPVILMLAVVWAIKTSYLRAFDRLMFSTIFILSIPILFGTTVIQARMLYVVPLYIPAFMTLLNTPERENRAILYSLVAIVLSLAVSALRATANLYLVVPGGLELEEPFLVS
jgi:hypothetical protein